MAASDAGAPGDHVRMVPGTGMFRALVERCPLVTYACDPDGALTYTSPQITEWTGLPARLWTDDAEHWIRMLHPDDRERVRTTPVPIDVEYRMRGRDGWLWVWEKEVTLPGEQGSLGICVDISARREAELALQAAQERLGAVVGAAPVVLFATDAKGVLTVAEGKGLETLGRTPAETVGLSVFEHFGVVPEISTCARRALGGEQVEQRIDFGELSFDCSFTPTPAGGMLGIAIDVTDRRRSEEHLVHLAYHDPLTGLPNRRNVEEQLGRELARARREQAAVAVLYLDVDHFKLVNDSLGHSAGDVVLRDVAERIRAVTRAGDLVARLGGDEFVLMLPGLSDDAEEAAELVAGKILAVLDAPFRLDGEEFQLGASIGIALAPAHGHDAGELLKHADAAMYAAKQSGRDAFAVFQGDVEDRRSKLTLTARLRRALDEEEFSLHFQPVHDLANGRLRGVEALVRWVDPAVGFVLPGEFIPHAEETGLITRIGDWVLDTACRQAAEWARSGHTPLMSFNASPRELRDAGYVERVAGALGRHGLRPRQVMIEVTESAMHESERVHAVLEDLHGLGVLLALDDFGTEHSSLSRLRALPVDVLKVDRSFLRDVPGDPQAAAIVQAIATLGGGLDMHVVAEGIEREDQRAFAAAAGCQYGQGYHFSRPVPAAEITRGLATSSRAPRRPAAPATGR